MKRILPWFVTALWMFVIWCFSAQPHSGAVTKYFFGEFNVLIRKLGHVSEYTILFLLMCWSLRSTDEQLSISKTAILAASVAFSYAIGDECHQAFVPGRSATLFDVSVDCLGVLLGVLFVVSRFGRRLLASFVGSR